MSSAPHALIAGAGIGGLSAALCLAQAGFSVSVFEQADALEEVGAGLQISPNASAILRQLGALERLRPSSLAPRAVKIRRARDGALIAVLPLADAESRWGAPYLLAHRADLQRALLETALTHDAITICAGAAVAGFASGRDGVAIAYKRGAIRLEATGDCLIGADGLRSFVRQRLVGSDGPQSKFSGRTAWRALVDANRLPAEMRRPESALWLGSKAHLVHYPLRGGAVVNVVAIVDEDFRGPSGDFWSSQGDAAYLEARFARWHESAKGLLAAASEWRKWPLYDSAPLARWTGGRVALLGDAAHPMLPFLAQGAAQAIEDAAALGRALAGGHEIEQGLAAYQTARRARATRVQQESRRQGTIYHLSGAAGFARDLALRALGAERLRDRYDWLYDARPRGEASAL
ncbi:FAD-dependent monooxygenase [Methylocapsa acidiphila]|uniref:FAD-dependent monooxygenase n=1 Tax=Methylocapsa acidiphila TaxID=133552 RepID=UPI00042176F2|nr:FAD-dependent monooxygenase [Methylocapsa acidiphila]